MFGNQNNMNKPFGTSFGGGTFSAGFGSSNSTFGAKTGTGGFGSGGFGNQTPASTGLFGSTNTSTAAGGLFGGSAGNTFGQQQQPNAGFGAANFGGGTTGSGLFGGGAQQQSQASSLFSTPTTNSVFGTKTPGTGTGGGFGGTQTNVFGAGNTGGSSLFGGQSNTSNLFGQTPGGFANQNVTGTTVKFNPPNGQDTMLKGGVSTNIQTRHQCITAMKEYENKSLEELRCEDYTANRKGPQGGTSVGLIGGTQNTGNSFSFSSNKPGGAFGFGTQGTTGTTGGGMFGQQPTGQQNTSLFGGGASKPLFGSTPATATTTASTGFGSFGTTSVFGQQNQAQNKSLFGATTSSGGLFGTNTQTSTAGFGQSSGGFGFGQTAQGQQQQSTGLFGAKPTAFGTAASSAGGFGFGQQNTGGIFSKPATSSTGFGFGQTSTGFGTSQASGGLFGNKPAGFATGTSFGTGLNTGGTSLFGNNQTKPGGLNLGAGFGTNTGLGTSSTAGLNFGGAQTSLSTTTEAAVQAQQAVLQQHMMYLQQRPYGDNPLFRNVELGAKHEEALKPTNPVAQKAVLSSASSQYKVSSRPMAKIKPKPIQSMLNAKSQLFDGFEEEDSFGNSTFVPRKSIKKLVIKKKDNSLSPGGSPAIYSADIRRDTSLVEENFQTRSPGNRSGGEVDGGEDVSEVIVGSRDISAPIDNAVPSPMPNLEDSLIMPKFRSKRGPPKESSLAHDDSCIIEENGLNGVEDSATAVPHPAGIILRRPDYYTIPTLDELATMTTPTGSCVVDDFVIGRTNYGNVFFPGQTDVSGLNLDEIVHFRHKEITVYPDEENKPPEGEGLNKLAQVTLERVWPNDKTTHNPIMSPERLKLMGYEDRIMRATAKMGARFLDYRSDKGAWVFEVKHFSKYGLQNDSDDEDEAVDPKRPCKPTAEQLKQLAVQKAKIVQVPRPDGEGIPVAQLEVGEQPVLDPATSHPLRSLGGMASPEMGPSAVRHFGLGQEDSDMVDVREEPHPHMEADSGPTVPASQRLASQLGVSAQNVQLMKASFFGDEEEDEEDVQKPRQQFSTGRSTFLIGRGLGGGSPPAQVSPLPVLQPTVRLNDSVSQSPTPSSPVPSPRKHSFFFTQHKQTLPPAIASHSGPSVPEHPLIPSGMTDYDLPRKMVGSRVHRGVTGLRDSIMYGKQHMSMDAGLLHSRGFRVGWGPGFSLVHNGKPIMEEKLEKTSESMYGKGTMFGSMPSTQSRLGASNYQILVEQVLPGTPEPDNVGVQTRVEELLSLVLQNSEAGIEDGCPVFAPQPGVKALHEYSDLLNKHANAMDEVETEYLRQCSLVLELCCVLWGDLPGHQDLDPGSYTCHQARREALSRWLTEASRERSIEEVQMGSSIAGVWSHLTVGEFSCASRLAQESGDHRLALLLAQAASSAPTRHLLAEQLQEWAQQKADQFVDLERLRVYALLAGKALWQASVGMINTCDGLDWKRCLAVHLWYVCPPSAGISDALKKYTSAFSESEEHMPYCVAPLPPYLENNGETVERNAPRDTCYHLLQLYTDRTHPLHHALAPTTAIPNHLDYRLSWLLWCVLHSVGYTHLSVHQVAALCSSYAAQLDSLGLWHWAVFVLLHIPDSSRREHTVRELLGRRVTLAEDDETMEREIFLLDRLNIPPAWLHDAKWLRARAQRCHADEAIHLLRAGHINDSHKVLLRHIAAYAIINEEYGYLKQFLREMAPAEHSMGIQGWTTGGKVFLDYITMMDTLEEIKKGDLGAYELERLQPEVASLCNRLISMDCVSPADRLCQSEMAKRTANLMRTLLKLQHGDKPIPTRLLAPHVGKLPLPEDYALQELRHLTRGYMLELGT